ncbi:DUF5689 domain-containing protein [Phocaeicola coprocola]|uniref:DUF5689 domain-containing protein n=1 Tax=Phocaeicola coprocola TaxID=310298 RepID=UPI0026736FEB|nr:DUF5689 domain-containing protein [Phocaeicola coprocola]
MAKFKSLSFWYGLLLMVLTVSFTACVDDNDDTEAPYLEVDPTTLTFENGGTQSFNISTNRPWNAAVEDNTNWVTLSKTSGEGSTTVQVSVPEGTNGEAKINITIGNQSGPLKTATVTVKSGVVVESKVLYSETVGNKSVSSPWPLAGEYDGWNKTGDAAANVTYAGNNASVRSSGLANTDAYEGASGPNVVFFGSAPANFDIQKIALAEEQTNLKLTFGGSRSSKGDDGQYDNTFDTSKFKVELSADGTAWTEIAYEKNNGDAETPYWIFATANFTLKKATSELYIRFTANESSVYRLDDITLATGNGGQEVDLEGGSVVEPGEATAITIPELIALMPEPMSTGEVIDANADRFFEAVVQADVENGNFTTNNLQVATEGATGEKNGVTLYGSQVDPKTLGLKIGDKVKVTLVKGAAKVQNYQGLYEVTGAKDETWCKVEKVGTANVTPIEITADKLAAYQAMTVTIKNASSNSAGTWCTADKYDTHTFTADGTDFTVYCQAGSVFAGQTYVNATGDLTGVATMYRSAAQIAPRNLDDVKAFSSSEPAITGVDPDKVSFTAEGGTKDITVTVANAEGKTLSTSGLSGILSATVSGTVVTVKAGANTTADAVSQTLKITLDGTSSSVEVPVTVAAQGTGSDTKGTFTSMDAFLFGNGTNDANMYEAGALINGSSDEISGIKFGTSSKAGVFTSGAIGVSGDKKFSFYAGAYSGGATLYIKVNGGGAVNGASSVAVPAKTGIAGNPPFTVNFEDSDYYTLQLTGLTATSTITISTSADFTGSGSSTGNRAFMCGIQLY